MILHLRSGAETPGSAALEPRAIWGHYQSTVHEDVIKDLLIVDPAAEIFPTPPSRAPQFPKGKEVKQRRQ